MRRVGVVGCGMWVGGKVRLGGCGEWGVGSGGWGCWGLGSGECGGGRGGGEM